MIRILVVVLLGLLPSSLARADEATARKRYEAGERAYNLGQFDKAIELFRQAYEEWPEPAFLFNIAQTYRQIGDCKNASFFYKRFLALKQNDPKKPIKPDLQQEVEKRIAELEECIKRDLANKPPTQLDNATTATTTTKPGGGTQDPNTTTAQTEGEVDEEEEEEEGDLTATATTKPTMVSARIGAGAAKLGAGDLDPPMQFAGTIIGGYPLALVDKLQLDIGAAIAFTPVPYQTTMGMAGSGAIFGILANLGPSYMVIPKLSVRADVGAGALVFTGLGLDGNPFTKDGLPASGPLSTFMVRAALSADYAVTKNILVTATPISFSYSPAPAGFKDSITSLTTLSFLLGVGYQR